MIDTSFDFRSDAGGRDPDSHSPTLRRYHQRLWSKPLPGGAMFALTVERADSYLYHRSELGEFFLASDTVVTTLTGWTALQPVVRHVPAEETEAFLAVVYVIGGMMVFPGNRIDGKQTINGERGFHRRIADRMDLTLECIRRHYRREDSPLSAVLDRHADSFALFGDFGGYVDFFLLQDLVTGDFDGVRSFTRFADLTTPALPQDLPTYLEYRRLSIEFVRSRNRRIAAWDVQA
ncbi:hypothetical protein [Actinotalea sp. K2]|uniref:DUF6994 family protein n=1 Tax=Actinotalea sp. K2 TaxID=2939438 RepID=UPI002016DA3A|nr:hypothetical protein [Actinotalea sp. K2]MCL3859829.1 hypothetical protein [Actinotalea sp. K2]